MVVSALLMSSAAMTGASDRGVDVSAAQKKAIRAAKEMLRGHKADIYAPNQSVGPVLEELLTAEAQAVKESSWLLLSGCRPHSCMEKGAAALDNATGELLGIAFISFDCKFRVLAETEIAKRAAGNLRSPPGPDCQDKPTLLVYLARHSSSPTALRAERELLDRFRSWGEGAGTRGEDVTVIPTAKSPTPI